MSPSLNFGLLCAFVHYIAIVHSTTLNCLSDIPCYFNCSNSGINCQQITLNCVAHQPCFINCTGTSVCQKSTINRNSASSINITCIGTDACKETKLTCEEIANCVCIGNCTLINNDSTNNSSNNAKQSAIIGIIIGCVCIFLICLVLFAVIVSKIIQNQRRNDQQMHIQKENIIQTKTVFVGNHMLNKRINPSQNLSGFDFGKKHSDEVQIVDKQKATYLTAIPVAPIEDTLFTSIAAVKPMFNADITPGNELGIGFMAFEKHKQQQKIIFNDELSINQNLYESEAFEEKTFEPKPTDDGNGAILDNNLFIDNVHIMDDGNYNENNKMK